MTVDLRVDRLQCGADLADLVEQVADHDRPRTAHQEHCPYCRAALTELTLRWAPLRDVAAEPVAVPDDLYTAVMRRLRRLAPNDNYARWLSEHGTTRVGSWVLEQICAAAAGRTPGVAAVERSRVTPVADAAAALPGLAVHLRIVATTTRPLTQTVADVQGAVVDDLQRYAGLASKEIDVDIVDIAVEPSPGHRRVAPPSPRGQRQDVPPSH